MTVEEMRGSLGGENDKFPVGMRVLAVDDDPTCLMLLGGLLRKCQYQVTTTSHAKTALKMLRENKNRFDLIISDVHMPDMDGFKLLELVGLEMDLPVIMLSANSDSKLVMKGITHGACDYLVKPVRLEELKNIWQHVIRRKKFESKHINNSTTEDKAHQGNGDGGQGPAPTANADQNENLNRKRKDEEEESEDNVHEAEDLATHKKPRVVWSIELHGKFVSAVNQLGIEKAVPKRILDLMNVEGLSRENVASHLQKYRLYLKRISSVAIQQANMVAALGGKDYSYMRSLEGLGDFRTLAGPGRFSNSALPSYQMGGMLGRLNSSAGLSLRSLSSSALIQPNRSQNLSNSIPSLGKFHPVVLQANQNCSLFQGIPTSLELDQLQRSKCTSRIAEFNVTDDPTSFTSANSLTDTSVAVGTKSTIVDNRAAVGSSSNTAPSVSRNPLILQGNPKQKQSVGVFSNQSSFKVGSLNSELFNSRVGGSNVLDNVRYNENLQSPIQLPHFSSNAVSLFEHFNQDQLPLNGMRSNNSSTGPHTENSSLGSSSIISTPMEDSRVEVQFQAGLVGSVVRNMNQATDQRWGEPKQDYTPSTNHIFSTLSSKVPVSSLTGPLSESVNKNNGVFHRNIDTSLVSQTNSNASTLLQHSGIDKSSIDLKMRSEEDYVLEQMKFQGGFVHNGHDSLDDLMNALIKREQEGTMLMDGEFGFDAYSFGSCL